MASTEVVPAQQTAPPAPRPAAVELAAVELAAVQPDVLLARMSAVEEVVAGVMVEDVHYGKIPGVKGPSLLKPGVEILAAAFQLALDYDVADHGDGDSRRYVVHCRVIHQASGNFLGAGMGECSTSETRYKWRGAHRKEFDSAPADRRREKLDRYSGEITLQVREELEDKANTALKMACKRAASDAVLAVLGVRGMVLLCDGDDQGRAARAGSQRGTGQTESRTADAGQVDAMLTKAAAKGLTAVDIELRLQRADRHTGPLRSMPVTDLAWIDAGLDELPDIRGQESKDTAS